jgi:hypothetical protein
LIGNCQSRASRCTRLATRPVRGVRATVTADQPAQAAAGQLQIQRRGQRLAARPSLQVLAADHIGRQFQLLAATASWACRLSA